MLADWVSYIGVFAGGKLAPIPLPFLRWGLRSGLTWATYWVIRCEVAAIVCCLPMTREKNDAGLSLLTQYACMLYRSSNRPRYSATPPRPFSNFQ